MVIHDCCALLYRMYTSSYTCNYYSSIILSNFYCQKVYWNTNSTDWVSVVGFRCLHTRNTDVSYFPRTGQSGDATDSSYIDFSTHFFCWLSSSLKLQSFLTEIPKGFMKINYRNARGKVSLETHFIAKNYSNFLLRHY